MSLSRLFEKIHENHQPLLRPYTELNTPDGKSDVFLKINDTEFLYFQKVGNHIIIQEDMAPIRPDFYPFVNMVYFECRLSDNLLYRDVSIRRLLSYTGLNISLREPWLKTNNDIRNTDLAAVDFYIREGTRQDGLVDNLSNIRMALIHGINYQISIHRCVLALAKCFQKYEQYQQALSLYDLFVTIGGNPERREWRDGVEVCRMLL